MKAFGEVLLWLGIVLLYWLPSIVALARRDNRGPVIVVNGLLGWTIIGWIAALAMSVRDTRNDGGRR